MITMIGLAGLLGATIRLFHGGAPHVPDPRDLTQQLPGWLSKAECYLLFFVLGMVAPIPHLHLSWSELAGYALVSAVIAAGWNPGHGSYLNPGNGSKDDEEVGPIVRAIASIFGWIEGSVAYCCLGMSVRYGIVSMLAAVAMLIANQYVATEFTCPWLYAGVGFLAGPLMYVCHALGWQRFVLKPWFDPYFHNGPFELGIGALLYGLMPLATMTV